MKAKSKKSRFKFECRELFAIKKKYFSYLQRTGMYLIGETPNRKIVVPLALNNLISNYEIKSQFSKVFQRPCN